MSTTTTEAAVVDKRAVTMTQVVGGPSGAGDDVLVVDGNTRLSLTAESLIVTSETYPRHRCAEEETILL